MSESLNPFSIYEDAPANSTTVAPPDSTTVAIPEEDKLSLNPFDIYEPAPIPSEQETLDSFIETPPEKILSNEILKIEDNQSIIDQQTTEQKDFNDTKEEGLPELDEEDIFEKNKQFYEDHPVESLELQDTGYTSPFGRKVYLDQFGEHHSEITETMRVTFEDIGEKYINIPRIWDGKILSKEEAFNMINKHTPSGEGFMSDPETGEEFILYDSIDEAVKAAKDRMLQLNKPDQPWNQSKIDSTDYGIAQINDKTWNKTSIDIFNKPVKDLDVDENIELMSTIAYNEKLNPQGWEAWTAYGNDDYNEALKELQENGAASFKKKHNVPDDLLRKVQDKFGKDWQIAASIIQAESGWDKAAINENLIAEPIDEKETEEKINNIKNIVSNATASNIDKVEKGQKPDSIDVSTELADRYGTLDISTIPHESLAKYLEYEINTPMNERLNYKDWVDSQTSTAFLDSRFEGIDTSWQRTFGVASLHPIFAFTPSEKEIDDMINRGYLQEDFREYRYKKGFDIRGFLKQRFLYMANQPPETQFDELPEEFWSTETVKGILVNSMATIWSLPFVPFEMIEGPGEAFQGFLARGEPSDALNVLLETGKVGVDIAVFFAEEWTDVIYASGISPAVSQEEQLEALEKIYQDPISTIIAFAPFIKGKGGGKSKTGESIFKMEEIIKGLPQAMRNKTSVTWNNYKAAYKLYKDKAKEIPENLQKYVKSIEESPKLESFIAEQLKIEFPPEKGKPVDLGVREAKDIAKQIDPTKPDINQVKDFQELSGLEVDGVFGPKTMAKYEEIMGIRLNPKTKKPFKSEDQFNKEYDKAWNELEDMRSELNKKYGVDDYSIVKHKSPRKELQKIEGRNFRDFFSDNYITDKALEILSKEELSSLKKKVDVLNNLKEIGYDIFEVTGEYKYKEGAKITIPGNKDRKKIVGTKEELFDRMDKIRESPEYLGKKGKKAEELAIKEINDISDVVLESGFEKSKILEKGKEKPITLLEKTPEENLVIVKDKISDLNIKASKETLSGAEQILLNKLKRGEEYLSEKIKKAEIIEKKGLAVKEKESIDSKISEIEAIISKDFTIENVKSLASELSYLRNFSKQLEKNITNYDKSLNKIYKENAKRQGFDITSPIESLRGRKTINEFLAWVKKKTERGEIIKDGQLDFFEFLDEKYPKSDKSKSYVGGLMSLIKDKVKAAGKGVDVIDKPMHFWKMKKLNEYLKLRQEYLGKGFLAEEFLYDLNKELSTYSLKERQQVYDVLSGKDKLENIPDGALRDLTGATREMIDGIGESLVERDLLSRADLNKYKGKYIARLYERYLIDNSQGVSFGSPVIKQQYAKQRREFDPKRQKELGEITDPRIALSETITRELSDIFTADFMQKILENPEWAIQSTVIKIKGRSYGSNALLSELNALEALKGQKGKEGLVPEMEARRVAIKKALEKFDKESLSPDIQAQIESGNYVQVGGKLDPGWGALDGAYIERGIVQDFKLMRGDFAFKPKNWMQKAWKFTATTFKVAKVPLNVPTMARNLTSTGMQLAVTGTGYIRQLRLMPEAISSLTKRDKTYMEAAENGIFTSSFTKQELTNLSNWQKMIDTNVKNGVPYHRAVINSAKKAFGSTIDLYGKMDGYYKYVKYLDEVSKGKTPAEAARIAQDVVFDYGLVSETLAGARNHIPFITYATKVLPFTIKSMKNNPVRTSLLIGAPILYNELDIAEWSLKNFGGMSNTEWNAYQLAIDSEIENQGFIILPFKDPNGNMQIMNVTNSMPHGQWFEVGAQLSKLYYADSSDDVIGAITSAGSKGFENVGLMPEASMMIASKFGIVPTQGGYYRLYSSIDSDTDKVLNYTSFVRDLMTPGMLNEDGLFTETWDHLTGKEVNIFETPRTGEQIAAGWVGMNIYPVDLGLSLTKEMKGFSAELNEINRDLKKEINERITKKGISGEDAKEIENIILDKYLPTILEKYSARFGPILKEKYKDQYGYENPFERALDDLEKEKALRNK